MFWQSPTDRPSATPEARTRRQRIAPLALLVVLLPVLGGLAGLAVAALTPPRYTAHAYVLISGNGEVTDVTPSQLAQATARVAISESVLVAGGAGDRLLTASTDDRLIASSSPDSPLVDLAATAGTAAGAANLADQLSRTVTAGMSTVTSDLTMEASIFATASPPREATSPNYLVDVVAGAGLGAFLAFVVVALRRPREAAGRRPQPEAQQHGEEHRRSAAQVRGPS